MKRRFAIALVLLAALAAALVLWPRSNLPFAFIAHKVIPGSVKVFQNLQSPSYQFWVIRVKPEDPDQYIKRAHAELVDLGWAVRIIDGAHVWLLGDPSNPRVTVHGIVAMKDVRPVRDIGGVYFNQLTEKEVGSLTLWLSLPRDESFLARFRRWLGLQE